MKTLLAHSYSEFISLENLFCAWQEFVVGKRSKPDVLAFERNLLDNIVSLHEDLMKWIYRHGDYESFFVNDPKRRHIHKASVRDRLVHHAVYRMLYPFFDRAFVADSFSCRNGKGMHKAMDRFRAMAYKASANHAKTCWVLKCDVRKFFASIDQAILLAILRERIPDKRTMWLLAEIIGSFRSLPDRAVGLPLGNLTSQLFANVYLDRFDHWMKHRLKARFYVRYADDFVILSPDRLWLEHALVLIRQFLASELKLTLHPDKIFLQTVASGVDYLGWTHFPTHRTLRSATRRRMMARIKHSATDETLQSYLGLLQHGNANHLRAELLNRFWIFQ